MNFRMDSWDSVDQQDSSPLFNGRIPAEIRTLIFKFALAEFTAPAMDRPIRHDFFARADHEKLDDEPDLESVPVGQVGEQQGHGNGVQQLNNEDSPAPAVQGLPASALVRLQELLSSWDWFRPGYTGQRKIHTALLRTCRRVYLETYFLPSQGSKIFYNARGPTWCPQSPSKYVSGLAPEAVRHIRNLQIFPQMFFLESDLMDMVTGVLSAISRRHGLYLMPVSNLQLPSILRPIPPGALPGAPGMRPVQLPPVSAYPPGFVGTPLWRELPPVRAASEAERIRPWRVTEHITSLRIYLRRTDWWNWESNAPLVISPFNSSPNRPTPGQMQQSMRALHDADQRLEPHLRSSSPSTVPHWGCWGLLFLRMLELQTLIIDFETTDDKRSEMEAIVDWAHQHWRFPVLRRLSGDDRDPYTFEHLQRCHNDRPVDLSPWSQDLDVLSAADEPVQKTSWRGLPHHFAGHCPTCSIRWNNQGRTVDCQECIKMHKLQGLSKGPQLLVWTVNWKRKVPPRDPRQETNAGGEVSQEPGEQPRPWSASDGQQGGAGPSRPIGAESHVLAMLPEDAQHRTRRRRELDELMRREVTF